ncbi:MAG: hypothetical protein AAF709_03145 [Pseudomonadota bacterium]
MQWAAVISLFAVPSLSGCSTDDANNYLGYGDRVVQDSGDANASNQASQTIDPWSPASRNNHINQDGQRAHIAVRRYATDRVKKPNGLSDRATIVKDGTGGVAK